MLKTYSYVLNYKIRLQRYYIHTTKPYNLPFLNFIIFDKNGLKQAIDKQKYRKFLIIERFVNVIERNFY